MTIEERLEKLEIANRRLRGVVVLAGCAAALLAALAVAGCTELTEGTPNVVTAREFRLVDEQDTTRAWLGIDKDGPRLRLSDENGKSRAMLLVRKNGPGLVLSDENDKASVWLTVGKDGPALGLLDEKGKPAVEMGGGEGGGGMVNVYNALGKEVVSVQANKLNQGSVIVFDHNGEIKNALGVK